MHSKDHPRKQISNFPIFRGQSFKEGFEGHPLCWKTGILDSFRSKPWILVGHSNVWNARKFIIRTMHSSMSHKCFWKGILGFLLVSLTTLYVVVGSWFLVVCLLFIGYLQVVGCFYLSTSSLPVRSKIHQRWVVLTSTSHAALQHRGHIEVTWGLISRSQEMQSMVPGTSTTCDTSWKQAGVVGVVGYNTVGISSTYCLGFCSQKVFL